MLTLFKNLSIRKFTLDVYDKRIGKILSENEGLEEFLIEKQMKNKIGLNYAEMIQNQLISSSWIDFIEWLSENLPNGLIFRGIECRDINKINFKAIRSILKYGNDRINRGSRTWGFDFIIKDLSGLESKDFIWGAPNFYFWRFISRYLNYNKKVLFTIYDSKKLCEEKLSVSSVYTLAPGVNSFNDALLAVVLVRIIN